MIDNCENDNETSSPITAIIYLQVRLYTVIYLSLQPYYSIPIMH